MAGVFLEFSLTFCHTLAEDLVTRYQARTIPFVHASPLYRLIRSARSSKLPIRRSSEIDVGFHSRDNNLLRAQRRELWRRDSLFRRLPSKQIRGGCARTFPGTLAARNEGLHVNGGLTCSRARLENPRDLLIQLGFRRAET